MSAGEPYWSDEDVTLHLGDCRDVLPGLTECSVDAIVTDPPYELTDGKKGGSGKASLNPNSPAGRSRIGTGGGFMGRSWDATGVPFDPETWRAAYRVLKPGGHLLAFGGTRTWHRMVCAIEDAGFEIRDSIDWIYGQGFAKSLNVSVAIDKMARRDYVQAAISLGMEIPGRNLDDWTKEDHSPGDRWWAEFKAHLSPEQWGAIERAVVARQSDTRRREIGLAGLGRGEYSTTDPATQDAVRWDGWGTALKPAHEPICVARKPLAGTVAANVLEWGTGALNVDGCKVEGPAGNGHWIRNGEMGTRGIYGQGGQAGEDFGSENPAGGRWPTNVVFTHSADCELMGLRRVHGDSRSGQHPGQRPGGFGDIGADPGDERPNGTLHGDQLVEVYDCAPDCPVAELDRQSGVLTSGANPARRGSGKFRDAYGEFAGQPECTVYRGANSGGASRFYPTFRYQAKAPPSERPRLADGSAHETVKPLGLVRWLVRLVTPPGGTVADLFAGSGPTAEACIIEGFRCILIEQDPKSAELIKVRLSKPIQPVLFGDEVA